MRFPDEVIVCGIGYNIVKESNPMCINGNSHLGLISHFEKTIYLFTIVNFVDKDNVSKHIKSSNETIRETLYHEIWHLYCAVLSIEDHNTEQNANMFGLIAANIADEHNDLPDINNVWAEFKTIVTDIDDDDIRKIDYLVENTRFKFDEEPPI